MEDTHIMKGQDELRGYLLACCDEIDRRSENHEYKSNDLAKKIAKYLRQYIEIVEKPSCCGCATTSLYNNNNVSCNSTI